MEGIERLIKGNKRFIEAKPFIPVNRQEPFCAILSCCDSRVSPELIFEQGIGDLFVIRQAGNRATDSVKESLRMGVELLHIKLIIVLGHQNCMAISKEQIMPNIHKQVELLKAEFPQVEVKGAYFCFESGQVNFL